MQLQVEPDLTIPFPEDNPVLANFREKAEAACKTAELLGIDVTPTDEDLAVAEQAVYDLAENEDKANKKLVKKSSPITRPATYYAVNDILKEFSVKVVDNANQIRLLVTNNLILETANEDPKIRIRALELLGKITDVGLFTEKSEVTINQRSSKELVDSLRAKIHKLMTPENVEDVKEVTVNGQTVDLGDVFDENTVEGEVKEVKDDSSEPN
jgi:hypothetical protein